MNNSLRPVFNPQNQNFRRVQQVADNSDWPNSNNGPLNNQLKTYKCNVCYCNLYPILKCDDF